MTDKGEVSKKLYLVAGYITLGIAIVGIVLPVVPGAPFIIVSGYCFSRGSKRMHGWLRKNKFTGPVLKDWEQFGVLRPMTKVACIFFFAASLAYLIFLKAKPAVIIGAGILSLAASIYILTRPGSPKKATYSKLIG